MHPCEEMTCQLLLTRNVCAPPILPASFVYTIIQRSACSAAIRLYCDETVSKYAFNVGVHDVVLDNQARSTIQ
jgi:hypothetical protein